MPTPIERLHLLPCAVPTTPCAKDLHIAKRLIKTVSRLLYSAYSCRFSTAHHFCRSRYLIFKDPALPLPCWRTVARLNRQFPVLRLRFFGRLTYFSGVLLVLPLDFDFRFSIFALRFNPYGFSLLTVQRISQCKPVVNPCTKNFLGAKYGVAARFIGVLNVDAKIFFCRREKIFVARVHPFC